MKVVISGNKKQLVLSRSEWEKIGKDQGWLPKKRLYAAETQQALTEEIQRKQLQSAQNAGNAIRELQNVQSENPFINQMFLGDIDSVRSVCDAVAESIKTNLGDIPLWPPEEEGRDEVF